MLSLTGVQLLLSPKGAAVSFRDPMNAAVYPRDPMAAAVSPKDPTDAAVSPSGPRLSPAGGRTETNEVGRVDRRPSARNWRN